MSVETDGVEEAFEGQLRVLLTAAGQVGERLARAREESLRGAQADGEREARELRSRYDAERHAARAELGNVYRPEWWDQANPEQIASAYTLARAWTHDDPDAVRAEQQLRQEVRSRYGIDVDATSADPTAVREAVERAERLLDQVDVRHRASAVEQGETVLLMDQADAADRAAERSRAAGGVSGGTVVDDAMASSRDGYDSHIRRDTMAADLQAADIAFTTAAARVRADVSQATPAAQATRTGSAPVPRVRRTPTMSPEVQRTVTGR